MEQAQSEAQRLQQALSDSQAQARGQLEAWSVLCHPFDMARKASTAFIREPTSSSTSAQRVESLSGDQACPGMRSRVRCAVAMCRPGDPYPIRFVVAC